MKKKLPTSVAFLLAFLGFSSLVFSQEPAKTKEEYEKKYQERITKEKINGIYIPRNLEDAFVELTKKTTPEARMKFAAMHEDTAARKLHFSLGRWMIVNWFFYEGSRFSHYLHSAGVTHPDDMADFMIIAYHRHLTNQPVVIKELAPMIRKRRQDAHNERVKGGEVIQEVRRKKAE